MEAIILKRMEKNGIILMIDEMRNILPYDEINQYLKNPRAYSVKKFYDLTEIQLDDYLGTDKTIRCHGRTKEGRPCKNVVAVAYEPHLYYKYIDDPGLNCHLHGGSYMDYYLFGK